MEKTSAPGQIVILNGAPRSGKSSIVAEIQRTFEGVWINLGVDRSMQATSARYQPGIGLRPGGERPDLEPLVILLYRALYTSIAAYSRLGLNVVVDVGHHDSYSKPLGILAESAKCLEGLPVLFVGVYCPLEIIMKRRRETGWNTNATEDSVIPAPVRLWQREVHLPGIYDLELDTLMLSPGECATVIRKSLEAPPVPSAFQQLAKTI